MEWTRPPPPLDTVRLSLRRAATIFRMAYLVTGAQGCIGSWVVKNLLDARREVVVVDTDPEPRRLAQLISPAELGRVQFIRGDITDFAAVDKLLDDARVEHLIHLAALQVPACQADPRRGALVNVLGTINLFEAVARRPGRIPNLVYASSCAVAGAPEDYQENVFTESSVPRPRTHYGVYKQCNEGNAHVYFLTQRVSSIGLRPWAVYGVGRDFGMTSDPTKAMKAAVVGRRFEIQFGGRADMQYADDVAKIFIRCAESDLVGARVYNLRGDALAVAEMVATIERLAPAARGLITHRAQQLPIVPDFDDAALRRDFAGLPRTNFADGTRETLRLFGALHAAGALPTAELP